MASYFDEIAKNRTKSIMLMLGFGILFALVVFVFVTALGAGLFGMAFGFGLILIYALFAYFLGDRMVLALSGAKEADRKQYKDLYDIIESLTTANELVMPKVYVIDDPSPNAFATGRNQKASSVAVTTGLLSIMNKNELTGVLAHEISHIADNDVQFMMLAIVFAGAIGLISAVVRRMLWYGLRRERGEGEVVLLALVITVGILAPIIALLIRLAISRRREYMADANGARIIRDPQSLASSLTKIQKFMQGPDATSVVHANEINSSMYFSNPFTGKSLLNLFSTHPPIEDRIAKLKQMY